MQKTEQKIDNIPWVEKYRPDVFEKIVLDDTNRKIFQNILDKQYFPNLLFFGPPGTGKTTTIINLINKYQENNNQNKKGLMIHLNASDERGIDIVRNNISNFVNSKNLFNKGTKFIILDEVDYMTKNAQQALKYLLEINNQNVRFCLICNYISRIDESLQNEFMRLRFNQLPSDKIIKFLKEIVVEENLKFTEDLEECVLYGDIIFVAIQTPHKREFEGVLPLTENREDFEYTYLVDCIKNISTILEKDTLFGRCMD